MINFDGNDEFSGFVVFKGRVARPEVREALSQPVDGFDYASNQSHHQRPDFARPSGTTYPFSRPAMPVTGDWRPPTRPGEGTGRGRRPAPCPRQPGQVRSFVFLTSNFDGEEGGRRPYCGPDVTALPHPRGERLDWINASMCGSGWRRISLPSSFNVTTRSGGFTMRADPRQAACTASPRRRTNVPFFPPGAGWRRLPKIPFA